MRSGRLGLLPLNASLISSALVLGLLEAEDSRVFRYVAVTGDKKTCEVCTEFHGQRFSVVEAELMFPSVFKHNAEFWLPRVHLDLWNRDTCRCALVAEGASVEAILQAVLKQSLEGFSPFQLRMHALALSSIREVRKFVLRPHQVCHVHGCS